VTVTVARAPARPALAIAGGTGPPALREVAERSDAPCPTGEPLVIDGATHDLVPEVLEPVLARFFRSGRTTPAEQVRTPARVFEVRPRLPVKTRLEPDACGGQPAATSSGARK
jgi:hypothetical protein